MTRAGVVGFALLAAACGRPAEREAPPGLPLGPEALAGATYIVGVPGGLDTVTLARGRGRDAESGRETLLLPVMTWGDLSGDDRREVAAVVVTRLPGTGALYEMVILADENGRPVQIAHEYLGDRVDVEGVSISARAVEVRMQVHGPNDPACCPTQRVSRRFSVEPRRPAF